MKIRKSIFFILIITLVSSVYSLNSARNAVIFLADDGGFEMGAYRNRICQTPNLDQLAKASLIFNNAYTSVSSCSPSRASLLTGQPSHQNGMYGLHHGVHHFSAFDNEKKVSLTNILSGNNIKTGLIGKKHVGPRSVFNFDYERTEEKYPINQVGRNITNIKLFTREFLQQYGNQSFMLIISFHDPHRCGRITPEYGNFCERWGSGELNMGTIPDWTPIYYQWDEIDLPYYVPDTEPARRDIAAQYQTISRLDQGVGLIMKELESSNLIDNTLVIYTSDNGPPLPSGRTNLYDPGLAEPMFISSPLHKERRNQVTYSMTSLLDIVPTLIDWYQIPPSKVLQSFRRKNKITDITDIFTGKSLLPLLIEEPREDNLTAIYASQTLHEVTMYYPMRAIRTKRYKLIHNLNYQASFPIDQDFYVSPTFQDILNRTIAKSTLPWYKTLKQYYERKEWEFFDLKLDPTESRNLYGKKDLLPVITTLQNQLMDWLTKTNDPWRCAPHSILQDKGDYMNNAQCLPLNN